MTKKKEKTSLGKILLIGFLIWLLAKVVVGGVFKPTIQERAQNDLIWQETEKQTKEACVQKVGSKNWCDCFWEKLRYHYTIEELTGNPEKFLNDKKFQEDVANCKL